MICISVHLTFNNYKMCATYEKIMQPQNTPYKLIKQLRIYNDMFSNYSVLCLRDMYE